MPYILTFQYPRCGYLCNWSPLGDRIRGLPLRSFPSDGLFVRLSGSLVVGALHLIQGEPSYPPPLK